MRIYIVPNLTRRSTKKVLDHICKLIKASGNEYVIDESKGKLLPNEKYDLVVSLGGDGTFLRSARLAYHMDIPVVGINTGHLGFLTNMNRDNYEEHFVKILQEKPKENCRKHTVISYYVDDSRTGLAINEVAFSRRMTTGVFTLTYENGKKAMETRASGLIVCSALGSTGFNLSAGGAIIDSELDLFEATPICGFDYDIHSRVISAKDKYKVTCDREMYISGDGEKEILIQENEVVMMRRAKRLLYIKKIS
ncbi:MAG: NAD(+)/NADH kinase [Solobacterium sp.]|nr:NAD(+)/NADH kinase [Solobacterium sp.]